MADDSLEALSEGDRQLLEIGKKLAENPDTRADYLRLIKKQYPGQVIPELDAADKITAATKPLEEKLAKMEAERLKDTVEARLRERREALKADGMSADDVKAIEELMVKESIPSHAAAARLYKAEKTLNQPTAPRLATVQMPIDKKAIKEGGGIKNWARTEASKAADDIKSGRVKLH